MRQQALSALRSWIVFFRRKHYVAPEREGARLNAGRRPVGLWPVVNAHIAKVMAEARLEVSAAGCIECLPGSQAACEIRSDLVIFGIAYNRLLVYQRCDFARDMFCLDVRFGLILVHLWLRSGGRFQHAHHLISHPVSLLLIDIIWLPNR